MNFFTIGETFPLNVANCTEAKKRISQKGREERAGTDGKIEFFFVNQPSHQQVNVNYVTCDDYKKIHRFIIAQEQIKKTKKLLEKQKDNKVKIEIERKIENFLNNRIVCKHLYSSSLTADSLAFPHEWIISSLQKAKIELNYLFKEKERVLKQVEKIRSDVNKNKSV